MARTVTGKSPNATQKGRHRVVPTSDIDLPDELWRDIPGYEGRYAVSSIGRVRSFVGASPILLALNLVAKASGKKHRVVKLYTGTGIRDRKTVLVHRLVLLAFVGTPDFPDARALHRNDVADDNRLENLYWGTDSDNQYDRVRNGYHHSEEAKKRMSEAAMGRVPWNKGVRGHQ